jgi:Cu/Ag efflux protein CusF
MTSSRRSPTPHPAARGFARASSLGLVVICGLATVAGCGPRRTAELAPPDQVYEVRGVVYEVIPGDGRRSRVVIRHQAIPDFVGRDGELVGMESMSMPFDVDAGVSLAGIEEGDAVEIRFEVRWEGEPTLLITSLEELPAGTTIDFGATAEVVPAPEQVEVSEPAEVEDAHAGH